jgi:hypothetical protein
MCWSLIGGRTLGVRDQSLFRWEQWGTCVKISVYRRRQGKAGMDSRVSEMWEMCSQKETKRGRNGQLSPHGAFYLGPGPILRFN